MNATYSFAEVAFPIPARQLFTYEIPPAMRAAARPGCRVMAPFGRRDAMGFITALRERPPEGVGEIKPLGRVIDAEPLFGAELIRLLDWTADYYMASLGETCSVAYPFELNAKPRMVKVVLLDDSVRDSADLTGAATSEPQRRVLEFLINQKALLSPSEIAREAGVSEGVLKTLQRRGLVRMQSREALRIPVFSYQSNERAGLDLTTEQTEALARIETALGEPSPKPILLRGVTGSGKTEVYLRAIESVLGQGKTAMALIPEISLTPQTMDRFRSRFGDQVGILHSALGQGERYDEWRMVKQGRRRIIVGARSAIFAPAPDLGLIIVDEEHESSYKQSDPSPRYHARDLAVVRASLCGALCILGSATPSVESMQNARAGKYEEIRLTQRIAKHGMPEVNLIDLRGRPEEEEILSEELMQGLWSRVEAKQQSILFLNRRGFSTTLTCSQCGHIISCRHCSVALVYHRAANQLICHHCDYREPMPNDCPNCAEKFIRQRGFGTEKVVHLLEERIPGVRVIRLDRDAARRKGDHDRLLTPFRRGEADVLVGTQMIAKGLDFPNVTLVGIINADFSLALPDFRAAERTFTLLTQVAGRSGRGAHPGEVFIQSYSPDHYSIQLALKQDYDAFFEKEIRYRRLIGFPPYSRLVLWRVEAESEDVARGKAWELYSVLAEGLKGQPEVTLLPPVEAPLYRLRDHYRWQLALKSRDYRAFRPLLNSQELQRVLYARRAGYRIVQDVDPSDML
ncbi:MAG: primosomal protein N' [bacterium]|nr:primosomal protein N' [bacterium]